MIRSKPKPKPNVIDSLESDDDEIIRIGDKLYSRKAYIEAMTNAQKELIEKRMQGITFLGEQEHPESAVGEELIGKVELPYKHYPYQTPISSLPPISEEAHQHNIEIACRIMEMDKINSNGTIISHDTFKVSP